MKNVSDESCTENQNKFCVVQFFSPEIAPFMCKNNVQPEKPQITIWRMRIA